MVKKPEVNKLLVLLGGRVFEHLAVLRVAARRRIVVEVNRNDGPVDAKIRACHITEVPTRYDRLAWPLRMPNRSL